MINNQKYWHDGLPVTSSLHAHLIKARGLTNVVNDTVWPTDLSDPFDMKDMDKAVKAIWQAVVTGKKIGIVGDYDMDGTPAAVLLAQFFTRINHPFEVILPTRREGYGFSKPYIDRFYKLGVGLIITVDCGITGVLEVEYADSLGIDAVITDHHQLPTKLPTAMAVVNPCRDAISSPTFGLCGTGVVFKLLQGLQIQCPSQFAGLITPEWLAWQLDLVALATLADMVPLVGENLHLVRLGLKILRCGKRVGLRRFIASLDLDFSKISYRDCTYKIIPRFNASGRVDTMDPVYKILSENDEGLIEKMIQSIRVKHSQTRMMSDNMFDQALTQTQKIPLSTSIIIVSDQTWHPGVTGLVAGRLARQLCQPCLVLANGGEGIWRGSGRSFGSFNLFEAIKPLAEGFVAFGGHPQAVGLSLTLAQLPPFIKALESLDLGNFSSTTLGSDGILNSDFVSVGAIEKLEELAPWGIGNPQPIWSMVKAKVASSRWLGDNKHLKLVIDHFPQLDVMVFDVKEHFLPVNGMELDLLGTLGINEFNNRRTAQLIVEGVVTH